MMKNNEINLSVHAKIEKDIIQEIMGSFGKYQLRLCCLVFFTKFTVALNQMAIIFLAPRIHFTCDDDRVQNEACPCDKPAYDNGIFSRTITTEWNLICERRWMAGLAQTVFQFGTLVGSIVFGTVSDRFGRRNSFLCAIVLQSSAGITAGLMTSYWMFIFLRFLTGMSVGGILVVGFVIIIEFVGLEYRDLVSALLQINYNIGYILLPLFGYFFRDYSTFNLSISLPSLVLLTYFFVIPETPRWLISANKTTEAVTILKRVSDYNKRVIYNIEEEVVSYNEIMQSKNPNNKSYPNILCSNLLKRRLLSMTLIWLACGNCFFGVSKYIGQLGGDVFVNVLVTACVTLVGTLLSIPMMKFVGRRKMIATMNFVCSSCLVGVAILSDGPWAVYLACVGVVASMMVFLVAYLYCAELFPTVVRSAALGYSSVAARVGSMVAPFMIELDKYGKWIPPTSFAILPLIAMFVVFTLPETKGCQLHTSIEEIEVTSFNVIKDDKKGSK